MKHEEELQRLFRAERAERPSPLAVEHGLHRLSLDLAAQVVPPPIGMGPLKLGLSVMPKWLASGFALGLVGASAALPPLSARPPVQATPVAQLSARPRVLASSPAEPETAAERPRQETPPAIRMPSAPATNSAGSASFDAELKLISFAKSELDARRPARAQAWLSEHAQRFPSGVFAIEREALFALAACQQLPPNVAHAKRFILQHPNSPLSARLENSCGLHVDSKQPNGSAAPEERTIEPSAGEQR